MWVRDNSCLERIQEQWNMEQNSQGFKLAQNFEHLSKQLTLWNKNHFGFIHEKLKNLELQFNFIQFLSQNNEQI